MLAAFLLAGLVAAPLATLLLFTRRMTTSGSTSVWSSTRRLIVSLGSTVILAALLTLVLRALDVTRDNTVAGAVGFIVVAISLAVVAAYAFFDLNTNRNAVIEVGSGGH